MTHYDRNTISIGVLSMTAGSETRASMAVVVIGGLLTSTVFTLVIIPILFVFMKKHSLFRRKST